MRRIAVTLTLALAAGCTDDPVAPTEGKTQVELKIVSLDPTTVFLEGGTTITVTTENGCAPAAMTATVADVPVTLAASGPDTWTFTAPALARTAASAEPLVLTCASHPAPDQFEYAPGKNTATATLTYDPALEPAPTVTGNAPTGDRASVLAHPFVVFDRAIDAASITPTSVRIEGVEATVSWDAATRTATLTPVQKLAFATSYKVVVAPAVKTALSGKTLAAAFEWTFSTRRQGDGDPWLGTIAPGAGTARATDGLKVVGTVGAVDPVGHARTASGSYKVQAGFTYSPAR